MSYQVQLLERLQIILDSALEPVARPTKVKTMGETIEKLSLTLFATTPSR